MSSSPPPKEPRWINHLLTAAALLACVAAVTVFFASWQGGRHHRHGLIADLTFNLGGRTVREHCTTCHPEGKRPHSEEGHPDITPHSIERLGCTGCHLGEGMALDVEISHGLPGLGARTVLKGKELEASCYRCHEPGPLAGAEVAWKGYRLFVEKACDSCHHVAGLGRGGRFGPDLSTVGTHLGLEQIGESIREPKKEPVNSIMPRFPLSSGQVAQLGYFLKSRVIDPYYATPMQVQSGLVSLSQLPEVPGEGILMSKKCLACHRYREEDGRIAPDLSYIGAMRSPDYLRQFLANPNRLIPGAIMPKITMSAEQESEALALLTREAIGPVSLHVEAAQAEASHGAQGSPSDLFAKQLYMALCQRCHAAAGDGFGPIQPNLAGFPRPFLNNGEFFRRAEDERLIKSVENGVPGTSMPPHGRLLDRESRERLLDLLFAAFIDVPRHDKATMSPLPAQMTEGLPPARADKLFAGLCVRCHGIAGTGTGPEHLRHLPRPRNLTNRPYFVALSDERIARVVADGVPGTAMPAFREQLEPVELWTLVMKVRSFSEIKP